MAQHISPVDLRAQGTIGVGQQTELFRGETEQ